MHWEVTARTLFGRSVTFYSKYHWPPDLTGMWRTAEQTISILPERETGDGIEAINFRVVGR
jgi:hypothetical protein